MPPDALKAADAAADDAVEGARLAKQYADQAEQDRKRVEDLTPDPNKDMIAALASEEANALLRIGPRRNRWRDLLRFEEQLSEIERRRDEILREIGDLNTSRNTAPEEHAHSLEAWFEGGQKGQRPASPLPTIDQQVADLDAEYRALGIRYRRVLGERADHIRANQKKMAGDVAAKKAKTLASFLELVDSLESTRQDLLALRADEVWVNIFPNAALSNEPNTHALVGAMKRLQAPVLPGIEAGLAASGVFDLLRADGRFCSEVATTEQAAAERGVTVAELTKTAATWDSSGGVDFFGPRFEPAWGGSPEEKVQADRVAAYTEAQRRRLLGEP